MTRDPSRLFTIAAFALLAVALWGAWKVATPAWKGIQRQRLEQQQRQARLAVEREREAFEATNHSLAYQRAVEAAAQEKDALDSPQNATRRRDIATRLDELEGMRAERQLQLARSAGDADPSLEARRLQYVRLTGTPGTPASRIQELERELSQQDLASLLLQEELLAIDREMNALEAEATQIGAASEAAGRQLAAFRADLDRAEARLTRLQNWRRGVHETITPAGGVERCVTCHPGLDDLASTHPGLGPDSPFQGWGCTVCHSGNGRALTADAAHRHLTLRPWTFGTDYTLEPVIDELSSPDKEERSAAAAFLRRHTGKEFGFSYHASETERQQAVERWETWWAASRAFWLPPRPPGLLAYGHDASGRPEEILGSGICLRCHQARQRRHVDRWRATKFASFSRTEEVDDPTPCLPCHTTGYDERTGTYVQPGVTCEGCHGPGSGYSTAMEAGVILQSRGEIEEGERLLDEVSTRMRDQMSVQNVCVDCHDPFGVKDLDYEHLM